MKDGGTAVYLRALKRPGDKIWNGNASGDAVYWTAHIPSKEVLPIEVEKMHALGLWIGVSHIVTDHPVFKGLQVNTMMEQQYENLWSPYVLKNTGGELIVGSVTYGFYADNTKEQNHMGPEPANGCPFFVLW